MRFLAHWLNRRAERETQAAKAAADLIPAPKRYAAFWGPHYYPKGGWDDLVGLYHTPDTARHEAEKAAAGLEAWWQVVDLETGAIVCQGQVG